MKEMNFDTYLAEQMQHPAFAERFEQAGVAWDKALHAECKETLSPLQPRQAMLAESRGKYGSR